jgi:hypothetical protein
MKIVFSNDMLLEPTVLFATQSRAILMAHDLLKRPYV